MTEDNNHSGVDPPAPTRRRVLMTGTGLALGAGTASGNADTIKAPMDGTPRGWHTGSDRPSAVFRRHVDTVGQSQPSIDGIEHLVDEQMAAVVDDGDIVGAAATVVRSDGPVFTTGYGDTRVGEEGQPVDGETRFRIGSVSKLFVWTAAMQLIEAGVIDPDEDVRTYLDAVSIPDTYEEPITIAHLATHTAGFEERFQGTWVDHSDQLRPLPRVLDEEQPKRVRPPGRKYSYSNYGTALAGQVVADAAGQSFEEYVRTNLFEPLGMSTATFEQPRPEGGAWGYGTGAGRPQHLGDPLLELFPAGSMSASASDMARFLQAILGDGSVGSGQILSESGLDRMHDRWFSHHPDLDGMTFGWLEDRRDDRRVLWHNGAIPGSFYCHLLVVPSADLGLFVVYNTDSGAGAAQELVGDVLDEYVPVDDPEERSADGSPARGEDLEGDYRGLRVAQSTHARLPTTLQAGSVSVDLDGEELLVSADGSDARFIEREPLLFEEVDGHRRLAFEDEGDEISHVYLGRNAFRRQRWYESLRLHGGLAGVGTLGLFAGAVGWPAARTWRWLTSDDDAPTDAPAPDHSEGSANPVEGNEQSTGSPTAGEQAQGSTERTSAEESTERTSAEESTEPKSADTSTQPASANNQPAASSSSTQPASTNSQSPAAASDRSPQPAPASTAGADTIGDSSTSADRADWMERFARPTTARWLLGGAIASLVGFVAGVVVLFVLNPFTLLSTPSLVYRLLLLLPVLATLATILSVASAVQSWRTDGWRRRSAAIYVIVAASIAVLCWLLYYWNLFGIPG